MQSSPYFTTVSPTRKTSIPGTMEPKPKPVFYVAQSPAWHALGYDITKDLWFKNGALFKVSRALGNIFCLNFESR